MKTYIVKYMVGDVKKVANITVEENVYPNTHSYSNNTGQLMHVSFAERDIISNDRYFSRTIAAFANVTSLRRDDIDVVISLDI